MSDRQRKRNAKTRRRMLKALASPPVATDPRVTIRVREFDFGHRVGVAAQAGDVRHGAVDVANRWRHVDQLIARLAAKAEAAVLSALLAEKVEAAALNA